jgi:hypothetical protein
MKKLKLLVVDTDKEFDSIDSFQRKQIQKNSKKNKNVGSD